MSVYCMGLQCLLMPEEGTRPETRVTDSCEPDWEECGQWHSETKEAKSLNFLEL